MQIHPHSEHIRSFSSHSRKTASRDVNSPATLPHTQCERSHFPCVYQPCAQELQKREKRIVRPQTSQKSKHSAAAAAFSSSCTQSSPDVIQFELESYNSSNGRWGEKKSKTGAKKKFSYFSISRALCVVRSTALAYPDAFWISFTQHDEPVEAEQQHRAKSNEHFESSEAFDSLFSSSVFVPAAGCCWQYPGWNWKNVNRTKSHKKSKSEQQTNEKEKVFPTEKSKVGDDEQISSVFHVEASPMHVKLMGKSLTKWKWCQFWQLLLLCLELAKKFVFAVYGKLSTRARVRWATHKKVIKNFPPRAQQQQLRRVRVAGNDTQHEKRTHHCKNFSVVKISQKSSDSAGGWIRGRKKWWAREKVGQEKLIPIQLYTLFQGRLKTANRKFSKNSRWYH